MARLDTIQPYVEQLFEDNEVRDQLSRAAANLREARARAAKAKSKKQAAQDGRLRRRLLAGIQALVAAGQAIARGPQKQRRRTRGKRVALLALAGAAVLAAANPSTRRRVLDLTGTGEATT